MEFVKKSSELARSSELTQHPCILDFERKIDQWTLKMLHVKRFPDYEKIKDYGQVMRSSPNQSFEMINQNQPPQSESMIKREPDVPFDNHSVESGQLISRISRVLLRVLSKFLMRTIAKGLHYNFCLYCLLKIRLIYKI